MSTITNRIFNLLRNETHPGQFELADNKADIERINLADLDVLESNIPVLREYIQTTRQNREEATRKKLEAFLKQNADLGISSVEDLIATFQGREEVPQQRKQKPKADNNTRYTVTLFNPETEKHEQFPVVNKILSKKIKEHPAYIALVKKDKSMSDVDNFLRAFSPEYGERYPINAKWKTKTFHINDQGKLNKHSQAYFNEHLKTQPDATTDDFRTLVKQSYKQVD
ncbi:hypothetical protein [Pantoea sp. S62]|uniref:hypothetical protein n=1 Tax=Pantoea sp. S62 TaxID=2769342 RepID=UPI001914D71E|nr:hypothetical protein [Pantoea sp. S62]MBK5013985.1 hypothetical protein [Pantoea sp. S62]